MTTGGKEEARGGRTVLVVDDEHDIREVFEAVLRYDGYEVLSCSDGQQAMELLRDGARPDAILLDLMMPNMDGWQFRVAQKAEPELAVIPVIAVSADRTAKAAAIDADVYLPKPVDMNTLLATLDRLLLARERETLHARLVEADRLSSLGTIAASVAHEINNPLSYAIANLELVSNLLAEGANGSADAAPGKAAPIALALADSREGLLRIRSIVRDLRTFSRPADDGLGPVDVERVLDSAANIVSSEVHHRARLVKDYGGVPRVLANESRLGQVCLNLIVNAAQSIPEGHVETNEIRLATRRDGAGRVVIEVHDTGEGIAEPLLAHIFEPFFTTKTVNKGTGLGLSICKNFVEKLGGTLTVDSAVGKGSTFRIAFPELVDRERERERERVVLAAPRPPEPRRRPDETGPVSLRSRVLVVDDEPRLCAILARLLGVDHDITTLTDATQAVARIRAGERFDVIFSDLMMPGMSGMELHAELARVAPQQARRMVFLTGGAFTPKATELMATVANRFLDKPFDYAALSALAREFALKDDE
jgi:signal transduction histidine kinase